MLQVTLCQFIPGEPLPCCLHHRLQEPRTVRAVSVIEAKRLFVYVPGQVMWFRLDIGSVNRAVKQAPKVLYPVRRYPALHIVDRVIYKSVLERFVKPSIPRMRVRENLRAFRNMSFDFLLKRLLRRVRDYLDADFANFVGSVGTLQDA